LLKQNAQVNKSIFDSSLTFSASFLIVKGILIRLIVYKAWEHRHDFIYYFCIDLWFESNRVFVIYNNELHTKLT